LSSGDGLEIEESDSKCRTVVLKPSVMWEKMSGGGGGAVLESVAAALSPVKRLFLFLDDLPFEGLMCSLR
jgi:hypothetical protein